jgi:transposase
VRSPVFGVSTKKHTIPGDLVHTVPASSRADLTDEQWAVLESLLPVGKKPGRPPKWSKRQLIDGIRWRVRAGAPWRDVPPGYGPWQTIYGLFRRWQRAGVWRLILSRLQALADAAGLITWDVSVDSTIARAHQHAAGARKGGTGRRNRRVHPGLPNLTIMRWVGHGAG